jgi:putative ATP-binding cassette transporter
VLKNKPNIIKEFLALARPYWTSEEKWKATGLALTILSLIVGHVYLSVLLNRGSEHFFDALQKLNVPALRDLGLKAVALVLGLVGASVYRNYLTDRLLIRWRMWMTHYTVNQWVRNHRYYLGERFGSRVDNADQRIQEDIPEFIGESLAIFFQSFREALSLVWFITLLWTLSGPLSLPLFGDYHIWIPGYLVWAALIYAAAGTAFAHLIGRPLVKINYEQQKFEATFRTQLIHIREHAEPIALSRGMGAERTTLFEQFSRVFMNFNWLINKRKHLGFFTTLYGEGFDLFPILITAPSYALGKITFGGLVQRVDAFRRVERSLSYFVDNYPKLAYWRMTMQRLTELLASFEDAGDLYVGIEPYIRKTEKKDEVRFEKVCLRTPEGTPIIENIDLAIQPGQSVLVTGATGAGKTTLLRATFGLWPFLQGKISAPDPDKVMIISQRNYLPRGSLRQALDYPMPYSRKNENEFQEVLQQCHLEHLYPHLNERIEWSPRLSTGEIQKLCFARVLLAKPAWVFLDEATSAIEESTESELYQLLKAKLPRLTIVSFGHRASLRRFHDIQWQIQNRQIVVK